jgi:secreted Zn-dependent insulinase-like peptidase
MLLISDDQSEKASVAMNVGVGSFSEPRYLPGLAHFLEHMLFMGSEKYPDVDEFPNLIALNTGIFNAFT